MESAKCAFDKLARVCSSTKLKGNISKSQIMDVSHLVSQNIIKYYYKIKIIIKQPTICF